MKNTLHLSSFHCVFPNVTVFGVWTQVSSDNMSDKMLSRCNIKTATRQKTWAEGFKVTSQFRVTPAASG